VEETVDPCEGQDCSGHGTCVAENGAATCDCDAGYEADGLACVEETVDPCEGQDCSGHGTCAVENGAATCDCEAGYRADGLTCLFGEHTLSGTFTIDTNVDPVNGTPNTDQFNDVVGKAVDFVVAFNIESSVQHQNMMEKILTLTSGPMHVEFAGAGGQSLGDVAASLEGASFVLDLQQGHLTCNLVGPTSAEYFGFEFSVNGVTFAVESGGYPVMGPVSGDANYILRRYTSPPFAMTDFASGPGSFAMQ
jgi:hypothetical protein